MVTGGKGVNGSRGHKAACGGVGWRRRRAEAQRLRPPIAGAGAGSPRQRRHGSYRTQPSFTTVGAAVDVGPAHAREERLDGFGFGRRRRRRIEGGPTGVQVRGGMAIGEVGHSAGSE